MLYTALVSQCSLLSLEEGLPSFRPLLDAPGAAVPPVAPAFFLSISANISLSYSRVLLHTLVYSRILSSYLSMVYGYKV